LDDEIGFVCSVRRGSAVIESIIVHSSESPRAGAAFDEFCGGSLAMD
jgi:hypothetical protein